MESKVNWRIWEYVYVRQFIVLMRKHLILQKRYWRSTLLQTVFTPVIFLVLLNILQAGQNRKNSTEILDPPIYPLQTLSKCKAIKDGDNCISYMYSPKSPATDMIMQILAKNDKDRTSTDWAISSDSLTSEAGSLKKSYDFIAVENASFIYDFTYANPNSTLFGISFTFDANAKISTPNIAYQIWFNYTLMANGSDVYSQPILSLMRGLDEAILSYYADNTGKTKTTFDVNIRDWPVMKPAILGQNIVTQLGTTFFYCSSMSILIFTLNSIMQEKELKLRHAMEIMGLKPVVYWISTYISSILLIFVNTLALIAMGNIFGFWFFTKTDFGVLFLTFFLFGNSLIPLAMLFSTFFRSARLATNVAIFILIIGLLFVNFVFSNTFLGYIWWDSSTDPMYANFFTVLLPFFNFGKLFVDISNKSSGQLDQVTGTVVLGPGFSFSDLFNKVETKYLPKYDGGRQPDVPAPSDSLVYMIVNFFIFWIAAWIMDNIIPDEYGKSRPIYFFLMPSYWGYKFGSRRPIYFFLMPSYWGYKFGSRRPIYFFLMPSYWGFKFGSQKPTAITAAVAADDEDPEVKMERELVQSNKANSFPIRICNLRKVYRNSIFRSSKIDKIAVNNLCLTLQEGKLLALLGQNGAGKTTTMNILSGLTPASGGQTFIYGKDIDTQMDEIRQDLGVCSQHDCLFSDLTAKEHIELYGGIKGISERDIIKITEERFDWVQLTKVKNVRAGTFSGGMKRRLSLVVSTIGDPKVVFLDEPTTGMDPVNRRHVWSFIESFKKGRVIAMTSHSMEECDILGDRIAIMAHGKLRALGNSIQLKNEYGAGYRFSLNTKPSDSAKVNELILARLKEAKLEDSAAGSMIYQLPKNKGDLIPAFIKLVENDPVIKNLILVWGISQATLEEVFLTIIRKANPKGYSGYEAK